MTRPTLPDLSLLLARCRAALGPLLVRLPPLPGGASLWITLLSVGFLLAALGSHGRQMLQLSLDLQGWLWLLLGVGVSLLSLLANALGLGVVLRWLQLRPHWLPLVALYLNTNLRKYLPGGIWHLTSRLQSLRAADGPLETPAGLAIALAAVLLDPLVAAVAALALVVVGGWQGGLALFALLPLLLLWPQWLAPLLRQLEERQARRLQVSDALSAELTGQGGAAMAAALAGYPLLPLLAQLGFVLLRFGGFACCVFAFDLQASLPWTGWLAGFVLAWTVGLVVPGAPGGLGVFEAALLLRLGTAIPEGPLLAIALSYRLVVSLADLLAAALVQLDAWIDRRLPA
jgi:hypothetical protein